MYQGQMPIGIECLQSWADWYLQSLSWSVGVKEKFTVDLMLRGWQFIEAVVRLPIWNIFKKLMLHGDTQLYIILRQIGSEYRPVHLKTHQNLNKLEYACQTWRVVTYFISKLEANYFGFHGGVGGGRIKV